MPLHLWSSEIKVQYKDESHLKGSVSAKRVLQGHKISELLEETKENNILPDEESLIRPAGKSMIFYEKANRIKLC